MTRVLLRFPWLLTLGALILLMIVDSLTTKGIMSLEIRNGELFGGPIDILTNSASLAIMSVGMAVVLATAGVDLSVGSVAAIAGAVGAQLTISSPLLALPLALAAGAAVGLANGIGVGVLKVQPIVITLAFMVAGRGMAELVTDGQVIIFPKGWMTELGRGTFLHLPMAFVVAAGAALLVSAVFRGTALGLFTEAVGENKEAAVRSGISVVGIQIFAYTLCGVLAAIAGLMRVGNIRAADAATDGTYMELDAILAAVLGGAALTGGRFYVIGAFIGAIFIETLNTTMYAHGVSYDVSLAIKAVVILGVCLTISPRIRNRLFALGARS